MLLAALAVGLLFLLPVGPLQAQDDGTIPYAENGDGAVATFTATDPEGKTPVWSLLDDANGDQDINGDGNDDVANDDIADEGLFSIDESSGVLTFMDPPDYEAPAGGTGNNSNTYMVVVQVADGAGADANMAWKKVEVDVTNEEEDATTGIEMSSLQPQVSTAITVAYVDGVGNPFVDDDGVANTAIVDPDQDKDDDTTTTIPAEDVEWQWSRSSSRTGTYGDIAGDAAKMVSYTPDSSDANMYLRVTGTYEDGEGEGKTVMATSVYPVRPFRSGNSAPAFPDDFDAVMLGNQVTPTAEADDGAMEGGTVGDPVTANDANNDRLTYSLEADSSGTAADADVFQINRMTGQVTVGLKQEVNPTSDAASEVPAAGKGDSFTVTIKATDPSGSSAMVVMTITVDETDEAPVFTMGETSHMHKENTAATTAVYTFAAYDPENEDVTYTLSGADAGKFTINNGPLTFAASPDFEMPGDAGGNNVYDVMVKAASTGSAQGSVEKSTTLNVMVTVTNEDDIGMVELSAAQPRIGVEIRAINLTDPDGMVSGVTWQWSKADAAAFGTGDNVMEIKDATMASYTPVAADETKFLKVAASYTDAQGSGKMVESPTPTQSVQKVRNLAPMFTDEDTDTAGIQVGPREVAEDAAAGDDVGAPVVATDTADAETGDDNAIIYRLSGADAASFEISSASGSEGQITVGANAMLDHEATKNTYMVTLTATDQEGLYSSVDVTIEVTNVDEAPDLEGPSNQDFVENGTGPVATFTATDPEGKAVMWSLPTGDPDDGGDLTADDNADSALFSIDESSGVLTFNDPPDYEDPMGGGTSGTSNTYMVVVQVADGAGANANMAWKKVEVNVTNEEEEATTGIEMSSLQPQVSTEITVAYVDGVGNPFVDANGDANTAIMDPDMDKTDAGTTIPDNDVKWQWSRSSSRGGTYGDIAGDAAKMVSYTPDSSDANMHLRVTGTYEDGEAEGKTVMATSVYPVRAFRSDNSAPAFPEDFDSETTGDQLPMADVNDGAMEGDMVGDTVDANDANNDRLTYSLEADSGGTAADADVFQINRMTGQVTVGLKQEVNPTSDAASEVPPVGKGASFTVTIKATDPSGLSDTVVMTITADEIDEAPVFTMGETSHMHKENTAAATAVYTFAAYDPENEDVTFSLSGADAGKLSIGATSGELTFAALPNFEIPVDAGGNNVYDVMVKAASTGSAQGSVEKSTTLNVMVTVTNEDDIGMVELSAAQPRIGVEIRAINLTDPDGMVSGVTWQWSKADAAAFGTGDNVMEIKDATMASYTPVAADETKFLKVAASYTDAQGSGKMVESPTPTQSVQKVRNLAPMFTDEDTDTAGIQVGPREVAEDAAAGDDVGAPVVATDTADAETGDDNAIIYRLSGADAASFEISSASGSEGQITVGANAMLDHEATKNTYMVTLTATDQEGLILLR